MRARGPWSLLLPAAAALLATACAPGEVVGDISTTTMPFVTTTTSEIVLSDLFGEWDNGQLFLQVTDDGSYQVLESPTSDPNDPLMAGFVAREGANLIFVTNIYRECPGQTGVYQAEMDDGRLVLTLADDPCQFRATRFVSPWQRVD